MRLRLFQDPTWESKVVLESLASDRSSDPLKDSFLFKSQSVFPQH